MSHYIAIDPGDRWVGVATLYQLAQMDFEDQRKPSSSSLRRSTWRFGCHVLDRKEKRLVDTINEITQIIDLSGANRMVIEDYQIRVQGFNAFNAGATLKLLGALELMTQTFQPMPFFTVKPDNPEVAQRFWLGAWDEIRGRVDRQIARELRQHAFSAWRVLGMHMMQHDLRTLQLIHRDNV